MTTVAVFLCLLLPLIVLLVAVDRATQRRRSRPGIGEEQWLRYHAVRAIYAQTAAARAAMYAEARRHYPGYPAPSEGER
jgi:hypothetical protein